MIGWEALPDAALCLIAHYLPDKSDLLQARLVTKSWKNLTLGITSLTLGPGCKCPPHLARLKASFPDLQLVRVSLPVLLHLNQAGHRLSLPHAAAAVSQTKTKGISLRLFDTHQQAGTSSISRQVLQQFMEQGSAVLGRSAGQTDQGSQGFQGSQHVCPDTTYLEIEACHYEPVQGVPSYVGVCVTLGPQMLMAVARAFPNLGTLHLHPEPAPSASLVYDIKSVTAVPKFESLTQLKAHLLQGSMYLSLTADQKRTLDVCPWQDTATPVLAQQAIRQTVAVLAEAEIAAQRERASNSSRPEHLVEVPAGAVMLRALPNLTKLVAREVDLSNVWMCAGLAALTRLTHLELITVFISSRGQLHAITPLTRLQSLSLGFGTEWWITAGDLAELSCLPHMTQLCLEVDYGHANIDDDVFADEDMEELMSIVAADDWGALLAALPSVKHLSLHLTGTMINTPMFDLKHHAPYRNGQGNPAGPDAQDRTSDLEIQLVFSNGLLTGPGFHTCSCITSLHLDDEHDVGISISPTQLFHLAHLTSLKSLHLVVHMVPDAEPDANMGAEEADDAWCGWPSERSVRDLLQRIPTPHHRKSSAQPSFNDLPASPDAPGNPWLYLSALGLLNDLSVTVKRFDRLDHCPDADSPREFETFNLLHIRAMAVAAHLLSYAWARHVCPRADGSVIDRLCREVHILLVQCAGLADAPVATWLHHMPHLTRLSLTGVGWLYGSPVSAQEHSCSKLRALPAMGQHAALEKICLRLGGPYHKAQTICQEREDPLAPVPMAISPAPQPAGGHPKWSAAQASGEPARPVAASDPIAIPPAVARDATDGPSFYGGPSTSQAHGQAQLPGHSVTGASFQYPASLGPEQHLGHLGPEEAWCAALDDMTPWITIRPAHLPARLKHLELTSVRFSKDWEHEDATSRLPRLTQLHLNNHRLLQVAPKLHLSSLQFTEDVPAESKPEGPEADSVAAPNDQQAAGPTFGEVLFVPPTVIINWHFKHVIARFHSLAGLRVADRCQGLRWYEKQTLGRLPSTCKLKSRALELLGNLKSLVRLELQVAARMGWPAQEGLVSTLARLPSLRRLRLSATNLFPELYTEMHSLTQLNQLEVGASYQLTAADQENTMQALVNALPCCEVRLCDK